MMTIRLMNINGGWQGIRVLLAMVCILASALACSGTRGQAQSDVPISVSVSGSDTVDIETVISNTQKLIQEQLPGAYPTFISFVGDCANLSSLRGKVNLDFVMSERPLLISQ